MSDPTDASYGRSLDVAARFRVDDDVVSHFSSEAPTSKDRYKTFGRSTTRAKEYLVPRIVVPIDRRWPEYLEAPRPWPAAQALRVEVRELGPWRLPFELAHGIGTIRGPRAAAGRERILYRRDLIGGTVAQLLGDALASSTVLDIGCNNGFFSLDLAGRGAGSVEGIDLRSENIAQAQFLARHYGLSNVDFRVSDEDELAADQTYDVVLNLGVLYHVTQPVEFIRRTFARCRRFAVLDTAVHLEPVSGFFMFGEKDVDKPTEGRESIELHPTYRAAIDLLRYAGFTEVYEVTGVCDDPHPLYESGLRRCFLGVR